METPIHRCRCGTRPKLVKINTKVDYKYGVECPRCLQESFYFDDQERAIRDWNNINILCV